MKKSVPIQKGPVDCREPTMKGTPRPQRDAEDLKNNQLRTSGQVFKEVTTPKK